MVRVALTGGIASGKSTVARLLQRLGAKVSHSDEVARDMMQPGQLTFQRIVEHFGPIVVSPTGELDRAVLARLAFVEGQLPQLNALVHPAVISAQERWLQAVAEQDPQAVAVVESALVLETLYRPEDQAEGAAWRTRFDHVITVSAHLASRERWYIARQGTTPAQLAVEDFRRRVTAQWNDAQREQLADDVLHNDGTPGELEAKVIKLYNSLHVESLRRAGEARQRSHVV